MLTVHHLGVSQSERIVWLCEELEIPYELKVYDRDPKTMLAPPAYKALHPVGAAPIITDGDVVLPESGAIVEYIIGKYGKGRLAVGAAAPNFADYLFWLHYANASMLPALSAVMMAGGADKPLAAPMRDRVDGAWALVEARLGEAPYFAGDELTAADIMMVFILSTLRGFVQHDLSGSPNTLAYLKRISERPAYRRARQKGDPTLAAALT